MDKERFIQVLNKNKWVLYKVINTYCKDAEDRKDLEQEILIQLWKSFKSYNPQYKITTWMYRIAMNVSVSFYRCNVNRKTKTCPLNESLFQDINPTESGENFDEERKFLHNFINQLDEFNKEIIVLYLDNLSHKEIADVIGITEPNVKVKIHRIKTQLQTKLKGGKNETK